jgi:hypothetical protein
VFQAKFENLKGLMSQVSKIRTCLTRLRSLILRSVAAEMDVLVELQKLSFHTSVVVFQDSSSSQNHDMAVKLRLNDWHPFLWWKLIPECTTDLPC